MDKLLKRILNDKQVHNTISLISSPQYKSMSFKEKVAVYKSFNDNLSALLKSDLTLYVNKELNKDLYRNTSLYEKSQNIVINGLNKNPYSYIKDIIIYHLIYIYGEDLPAVEIGDVKYIDNYIESQCNIILYNQENIVIVEKVVKLMEKLLTNYNNDYIQEFKKEFDLNLTKEAKEDLLIANKVFDTYCKQGFYDSLMAIETNLDSTFILQDKEVSKEDLALLSIDSALLHVFTNLYEGKLNLFNKYVNDFVEAYFNEFKDYIKIKGNKNGLFINDHQVTEYELFLDALLKEMEVVNKKYKIIDSLEVEKVNGYNKLDSYFYLKLKEMDSYLENKNLEVINYVKWTSVYKEHNKNLFDDKINVFHSLSEDQEFLLLVQTYLKGKKNNSNNLRKIFDYLNKVYFDADFKLVIEDGYGDEAFGRAAKDTLIINTKYNADKISILTTLFHEYRHLIQEREVNENHNIYNKHIYFLIKYNNLLSDFNLDYSYFDNETYGYDNQFFYAMQPSEFDAESFSYMLTMSIFKELSISVDYREYFPLIYIDNKFISPQKLSINSYLNYLKLDNIDESYQIDKRHRKEVDLLLKEMNNEEKAIEIINHSRFIYLTPKEKEKVFRAYAGKTIKINYDKETNIMRINNKSFDLTVTDDYTILENLILLKGLSKIKNNIMSSSQLNDFINKEAIKIKPKEYNIFNILCSYYYHKSFAKYRNDIQDKNQNVKSKSVRSN